MKTASTLVVTIALLSATLVWAAERQDSAKAQAIQSCTFKVTGMTCAGCEAAVRLAARSVAGVTEVKASFKTASAEVTYDPSKTNPAAIAKAITDRSGFKAEPVQNATKK